MITIQRQPTAGTCAQACLAMALEVPVAKVIERFGADPMNQQTLIHALTECGVVFNPLQFGTFVMTGWYFAVVPSLNIRGGNHQILIHYDWDNGDTKVLDPSGRETYALDGSDLKSWSDLIAFRPGGRLPEKDAVSRVTEERDRLLGMACDRYPEAVAVTAFHKVKDERDAALRRVEELESLATGNECTADGGTWVEVFVSNDRLAGTEIEGEECPTLGKVFPARLDAAEKGGVK